MVQNQRKIKREIYKINQWEKLHIFDEYFKSWERVVYLDAGLRVLDDVKWLLELDYKNKLLAPIDGTLFKTQISYDNKESVANLISEYGEDILEKDHMLNCLWVYDTNILDVCNKTNLIEIMNKYPLCKTNEMTAMNLLFHFKYKSKIRVSFYFLQFPFISYYLTLSQTNRYIGS